MMKKPDLHGARLLFALFLFLAAVTFLPGRAMAYEPAGGGVSTGPAVTVKEVPGQTEVLAAENRSACIRVSWTREAEAASYEVYRKSGEGAWTKIARTKPLLKEDGKQKKTQYYDDADVREGEVYHYTVRAIGIYWAGPRDEEGVSTLRLKPAELMDLEVVSKTSLRLTWTESPEADGYGLWQIAKDGTMEKVGTVDDPSCTAALFTGLKTGKTYTYTVKAYKKAGGVLWRSSFSEKGISKKLKVKAAYENGLKLYRDADGELITDVTEIVGEMTSYQVKVNLYRCVMTVYAKDGDKGYTIPIRSYLCSSGGYTSPGTFRLGDVHRFWSLYYGCYSQWAVRIYDHILFHTVPYANYGSNKSLMVSAYNLLGIPVSHGCIRLPCDGVKWIYDHAGKIVNARLYYDQDPGPFGKPEAEILPAWHTWDPTDPTAADYCKAHGCHQVKVIAAEEAAEENKD